MIPVLAFVQHYKKFYTSQFESAAVRHGLNQLEIDILLFLHNNPDCRTASDICRYRGLAKSNVSKAVEHLRTMGLLTVSPAADNRRQRERQEQREQQPEPGQRREQQQQERKQRQCRCLPRR